MESISCKFNELETRIQDIERSHQRWRSLSLILFIVAVLMAGEVYRSSRRSKHTIEAERFVVRGADGRKRAELGLASVGLPQLRLFDAKGGVQVGLEAYSDDFSSLTFFERGQARVSLESTGVGSSSLRLMNPEEVCYANLYVMPMGRSGLSLTKEAESVMLGTNPMGTGLVVTDPSGQEAGSIGTSPLSTQSFSFAKNHSNDCQDFTDQPTGFFARNVKGMLETFRQRGVPPYALNWLQRSVRALGEALSIRSRGTQNT